MTSIKKEVIGTTTGSADSAADVSPDSGSGAHIRSSTKSTKSTKSEKSALRADDSGDDTPDTDKEEEDHRIRQVEAKKKGVKLVHRASFKRTKTDRNYDKYPWVIGAVSRLLGLHLAPVDIPWHRRMETLSVLSWMSTFLFMGLIATGLMIYMFFYTQYWWISLCYLCWYIPDRTICNRGGRRLDWMRRWTMWKHYRNFFPVHLIKTAELSSDRNYLMGYHPHGLLCCGAYSAFATEGCNWSEVFPGLTPTLLTLEALHLIPLYREFFSMTGACSATRASMDYLLGREGTGRALCLVIGGAPESLDCHPGQAILHLNRRKGFVKMALRHGASLVPMFAFGENDIYDQLPNPEGSTLRMVQNKLQRIFSIPPAVFSGRGVFQYSFGIVPYRKPIYVVVGAPIHVDPVKQPTSEQILSLHARYKVALEELYDTHKGTYAKNPDLPLKFL